MDDVDGGVGADHGDLGDGPRVVDVAAQVLRAHGVVGAAVRLPQDDRDFGHRRLGVREHELRAVSDDAAVFLRCAGKEAGHVDERDDGDVEGVAESHEARGLSRRIDVEHAGQIQRLVRDDAHGSPRDAPEADDDVGRPLGVDLHEVAEVQYPVDDLAHVVALLRVVGNDVQKVFFAAVRVVASFDDGRILHVVQREERNQPADFQQAIFFALDSEVADAAAGSVRRGAAQLLVGNVLACGRLDHVGAGEEHLRGSLGHEDEVGHRGRIHGAARAGAENHGDLRDDAGRQDVAEKDFAVAGKAGDAFLDTRATRVVQADDRRARLHRQVHYLAHLLAHHLRERAAEHGEVLREDEDEPALDLAVAGDDGVAQVLLPVEAELRCPVGHERVELFEGAFIEENGETLARGQFAARVLSVDSFLATPELRLFLQLEEALQALFY